MVKYIIKLIVKNELSKIKASSVAQFYDIICNTYNDRNSFENVDDFCCLKELEFANKDK